MEIELVLYALLFLFLLSFSAFFSGSKTAYFSLPPGSIDRYRNSDKPSENRIARLLAAPQQLLITIALGNIITGIVIATIAAILTTQISSSYGLNFQLIIIVDVIVVSLALLFLSEILPRVIAVRNPENFAQFSSPILLAVFHILSPIVLVFSRFTRFLQYKMGLTEEKFLLTAEELKTLVRGDEDHGALEKDERAMIHSIFEFGETTVKEIMIPRTDMNTLSTETSLKQLMDLVKVKLHSRIPVYKDRIDNIIGILYVKDLLPSLSRRSREKVDLEKLARPAYFVPEQKKAAELLREFQHERIHMAIVVDEYGGVAGLVTMEDVIEEIVGEIQDEYDKEMPLFKKVDENAYLVDGRMSIEEINEELNLDLPIEEGIETISGFILSVLGALPKEKESVDFNGYQFIVERVLRNRILKVRIEQKQSGMKIEDEIQS